MAMHYQVSRIKIILFALAITCSSMTSFAMTLNLLSCFDATPLILFFTALYTTPDATTPETTGPKQEESSLTLSDSSDLYSLSSMSIEELLLEEKRKKCIKESLFVKSILEKVQNQHLHPLEKIIRPHDYDKASELFNAIFKEALLYSTDPESNFDIGRDEESGKKIIYHKLFTIEKESSLETSYTEKDLIKFEKRILKKSLATNIQIFQAAIMRPVYKAIKEKYDDKHANHTIDPIYRKNAKKIFKKVFYPLKTFCDIKLDIYYNPLEHKNIINYIQTDETKKCFKEQESLEAFPSLTLKLLKKVNNDLELINHQYSMTIKAALKNHLAPLYTN